jgi:signal transduction histidine kinase
MAAMRHDRPTLERELGDLKSKVGVEMTVYDSSGQLLGSSAEHPPPPLAASELSQLGTDQNRFWSGSGTVIPAEEGGRVAAYTLVKHPPQKFPFAIAATQLAVILAVLALASIPMARSIAAPVEQLSALARAFGKGDYAVRANSRRKDEIGELARAFDEMANRIAQLRRSEKELIANVSHELRTPLARIRLALELVRVGDSAKAQGYLEDIEEDLGELERLLDDVMTTARFDLSSDSAAQAVPPLRLERVEARSLVEATAARFSKLHPDRRLERHFADELPELQADPPILRRVVDNLLDNAVKYSDAVQPIELIARTDHAPERLIVEVIDKGIGISEADLPRIFAPFFRSDPSRTRATGGVGLGLALARRVVEAHGGSIEVESAPGVGSRFRVTLPVALGAAGE